MEELFLGVFFATDELDIVDHQNVDRPEHFFEVHHVLKPQRADELVHEFLCREVEHFARRVPPTDVPGDGVHQMRLAEADTAIKEQRIEADGGGLCDLLGSGVGQLVRFADHEIFEGEARVKRGAVGGEVAVEVRHGLADRTGFGRGTFSGSG